MKKLFMAVIVAVLMIVPFTIVNAETKIDEVIERLEEDLADSYGKASYENDTIEIEWYIPNGTNSDSISFSYDGSVIEYDSGEITNYEEAIDVTGHNLYAIVLLRTALELNGYTDKQIQTFFATSEYKPTYEVNGFEVEYTGEGKEYTSEDGTMTVKSSPVKIRIDVTKANTNTSSDANFTPTSITIADVVEKLKSSSIFEPAEIDGRVISESDIVAEDGIITITVTSYDYDYYNVYLPCEDGVIIIEDGEADDYEEAESASSAQVYAYYILMNILEINGYTSEQIQEFVENNEFDYELNGIEFKEIGEEKKFTQDDEYESTVWFTPMSIKIDLNKANLKTAALEKVEYEVIKGAGQKVNLAEEELTFQINIEYSKFEESGNVYVDNELVDSKNYTSKEGSTIITFNNDYAKTLSSDEHTLKVTVDNGEASTVFTVENKSISPKTGDNMMYYVTMLVLSSVILAAIKFINKKINI